MDNRKIRLKSSVLVYHSIPHSVTLRFCSEIIKIDDENGDINYLFSLLCGNYTWRQLLDKFKEKYPDKADKAEEYLNTINELRLIEYISPQQLISEYSAERWSRNIEFFNSVLPLDKNKYAPQKKLQDSHVVVLGCGGLGSHLILELAALGVGNLTLVDCDNIELSNLNRQILYTERDIGSKKVLTAKRNIENFNTQIKVSAIEKRIESCSTIESIIAGHDLVICVADKPRNSMIKWLNAACCHLKIPFINGGLDIRRAVFYSVIPGVSGCTECWKNSLSPELRGIVDEDNARQVDYSAPAPALSALVAVTAGVMVCEAINLLTSLQSPLLINNLKCFNFDTLSITTVEQWGLDKHCFCCKEH